MVNDSSSDQDILEKTLTALIQILIKNKGKLFLSILLGGIIGIASSFLIPKKYTSKAELLPEFNSNKFGSLSSLASLAGLDAAGSSESDALRPDLFPNILQSSPALLYLLSQPVKSDSGKNYSSLLAFYEIQNEVKVKPQLLKLKITDSLYKYTTSELGIISSLKKSINSSFEKKSGIIFVSVEMTDPKVAAITLANCIKYLKQYVSEYRYGKKHGEVAFVGSQLKTAKERMQKAQYALQKFKDNNRNLFLNTAKIGEQKLEEDYSLAASVYNDLLRESEKLNIAEQEDKPAFQILEPPVIPVAKSSPNRFFFGVGGSILSFLLTVIMVLIPWKKVFS
ncbi:Wzz/FepE/Etk N-terminal domain-containing protein [Dyadobacter diqingensis]|uniref:Wzz/FepE/Etk N-terminal domain-containing protein n=1 Tax=Dyadobacter diqingensis TaxID=2938121 RepID=UPI0020C1B077|nr:Wzz/FepE/Etk N-terminal domain-containing protein [Dyadobacter diqingensis]